MTTTLLIDADVVVVRAALYCQTAMDFGDGEFFDYHPEELPEYIDEEIEGYMKRCRGDKVICCLSSYPNYRERIFPTYKGHRPPKPKLVGEAKQYIEDNYECKLKPELEGDDVLGILATHPKLIKGKKIIVSVDKDLKTIPGWLYNPDKDEKPYLISEQDADAYWIRQILTGDTVDAYPGCPGVGVVTVDKLFESPWKWVSYEHEFKGGPRKGLTEIRWKQEPVDDITWEVIVSFYEKAGQTEQEALTMARVARILRHTDYDFKTSKVNILDRKIL